MTDETVDSFRGRARTWLAANLPRVDDLDPAADGDEWLRARQLQKLLFYRTQNFRYSYGYVTVNNHGN